MPLTLEALRAKEFTTVRLRHGYRPQEVDEFLDEVEDEFCELLRANEVLRSKLAAALLGGQEQHEGPPAQSPGGARGSLPGSGGANAHRVLELAQQVAEEEVAAAHREAEAIVTTAHRRASDLEAAARSGAHDLEQQTREECRSVLDALEADRSALETEIDRLRTMERQYRSQVKLFLEQQMQHLVSKGAGAGDGLEADAQTSGSVSSHGLRALGRPDPESPEGAAPAQRGAAEANPASTTVVRLSSRLAQP
ncbi:DivIVA domain-containing protein [Streptomyces sp. TLI_235]|nr:DivIVA domain-containing protein [Streptomyces sp. TLI_235]PBC69655.1 DivIVA domain-containing protein [Streptomyces sp. TLI_235]